MPDYGRQAPCDLCCAIVSSELQYRWPHQVPTFPQRKMPQEPHRPLHTEALDSARLLLNEFVANVQSSAHIHQLRTCGRTLSTSSEVADSCGLGGAVAVQHQTRTSGHA